MYYWTGQIQAQGTVSWQYYESGSEEGLRICFVFFSSIKPHKRRDMAASVARLIDKNEIDWINKRQSKWGIDLDKVKKLLPESAQSELGWAKGTVIIEPEHESTQKDSVVLGKLHRQYHCCFAFYIIREAFMATLRGSSYIADEVIAKLIDHLRETGATGVLDEFVAALNAFYEGKYSTVIVESQKSLESVIKTIIRDDNHANPRELFKKLGASKLLLRQYANFPEKFLDLIKVVTDGRNQPGSAHGQGSKIVEIDRSEAELILSLAAVFNKYLMELYMQSNKSIL